MNRRRQAMLSSTEYGFVEYTNSGTDTITYNITPPDNCYSVRITACGGGGSGACAAESGYPAAGGGAGCIVSRIYKTTVPLTDISVILGYPGKAPSPVAAGASGYSTRITLTGAFLFTSEITIKGGGAGGITGSATSAASGGAGGAVTEDNIRSDDYSMHDYFYVIEDGVSLFSGGKGGSYSFGGSVAGGDSYSKGGSALSSSKTASGGGGSLGVGGSGAIYGHAPSVFPGYGGGSGANSRAKGGSAYIKIEWGF